METHRASPLDSQRSLTVRAFDQRSFEVPSYSTERIGDVKRRLAAQFPFIGESFELLYEGRVLTNEAPVPSLPPAGCLILFQTPYPQPSVAASTSTSSQTCTRATAAAVAAAAAAEIVSSSSSPPSSHSAPMIVDPPAVLAPPPSLPPSPLPVPASILAAAAAAAGGSQNSNLLVALNAMAALAAPPLASAAATGTTAGRVDTSSALDAFSAVLSAMSAPTEMLPAAAALIEARIRPPLDMLMEMGFPEARARKALITTRLQPEVAIDWLSEHCDDPDIDVPLLPSVELRILSTVIPGLIPTPTRAIAKASFQPIPGIQRCIEQRQCTFLHTGTQFMMQEWFTCRTCDLTGENQTGCCRTCAQVCHAGHDIAVGEGSPGQFFCDCGAGGVPGFACRSLNRQ